MSVSILLHLLAAILWIGGMAFAHFALRPAALATLEPPQRLPLMSAALGRFFKMAMGAVIVLLLTGLQMIYASGGFAAARIGVHIMFGGGILMMVIFGYVAHRCYPKMRAHVAAQEWQAAAAQLDLIRKLVAFNLLLGVLIVAGVKLL